ncbi:hypothetical protein LIER_33977 [Lithospermum erythrorhizon]|uniref:MULE transposase domain-containing protein n=1 Tax=Lithospermum erythrorhizon TaxID=34254 RepID=A0AAV3S0G4_LITER
MECSKKVIHLKRRVLSMSLVITEHLQGLVVEQTCGFKWIGGACGDDMGFTRKDLWNYVSSVKRMEMFPGDVVVMHKWLRDQVVAKHGFFYDIKINKERRIKTIFRAEAIMISHYCIFVGFNHHKSTTVFGAILMYDQTAQSFKWVFERFLKWMNSKLPNTIMTDQAPTIVLAIRDIFPCVFHALCSWHIYQNTRKRLDFLVDSTFLDFLNHLIRYVDSESKFEFVWQRMVSDIFAFITTRFH